MGVDRLRQPRRSRPCSSATETEQNLIDIIIDVEYFSRFRDSIITTQMGHAIDEKDVIFHDRG